MYTGLKGSLLWRPLLKNQKDQISLNNTKFQALIAITK